MSRTALMMGGFGDLSDEEEAIFSPSPRHHSSPKAGAAPAAGAAPTAGLSRLERLERMAAGGGASAPTPPEPVLGLAPVLPAAEELEPEPEQPETADPEPPHVNDELAVEFTGAGPLGLSFRGGRQGEGDEVVVAQVASAGAAAGRVQPGCVLRRVQGVCVAGKTHDEVIASIRQAGRPLTLVFSTARADPPPATSAPAARSPATSIPAAKSPVAAGLQEEIKVTFTREGSLGLKLDGSLSVRQLAVDGLAGQNPALSIGLILCGIQGFAIRSQAAPGGEGGCTHAEAVERIKAARRPLTLSFARSAAARSGERMIGCTCKSSRLITPETTGSFSTGGSYTLYQITVETSSGASFEVNKRFSDFEALHDAYLFRTIFYMA